MKKNFPLVSQIKFQEKVIENPKLFDIKAINQTNFWKKTSTRITIGVVVGCAIIAIVIGSISSLFSSPKQTPNIFSNGTIIKRAEIINYWPLSDKTDKIGKANLTGGVNVKLTTNRLNLAKSASLFNKSYYSIPKGKYLNTDISVTAWVNLNTNKSFSTLIFFGNGFYNNSFWLGFQESYVYWEINNQENSLKSKDFLKLNTWTHVAITLKSGSAAIYINGEQSQQGSMTAPDVVETNANYIGNDFYGLDDYAAEAAYSKIKIFNGALDSSEVKTEYSTDDKKNEASNGITWNNNSWSLGCTFNDSDYLIVKRASRTICESNCVTLYDCTHYVYMYENKECHLKSNLSISLDDAETINPTRSYACGKVNDAKSENVTQNMYLGCFRDNFIIVNNSNKIILHASNSSTILKQCFTFCKVQYLKFAAIQNGSICWCSDSYGKNIATNCNLRCYTNSKEFCGGINSSSVYDIDPPTLRDYWPMPSSNNSTNSSKMTIFPFEMYGLDRFNNSNGSIFLNSSFFISFPESVYFDGDFSITLWLKLEVLPKNTYYILDFASQGNSLSDNVVLGINQRFTLFAMIWDKSVNSTLETNTSLETNRWYHIGFVLNNNTGNVYLNGVLLKNGSISKPKNSSRKFNFMGKSNLIANNQNQNNKGFFDDFKIWKGVLLPEEVVNDFKKAKPSYYWSMSNVTDSVNKENYTSILPLKYAYDRFDNMNFATNLSYNYITLPSIYFADELSISIWFYFEKLYSSFRLFDFGEPSPSTDPVTNNITVDFIYKNLIINAYNGDDYKYINANFTLKLLNWYNLALVFRNNTLNIYINGLLTISEIISNKVNSYRSCNYIGFNSYYSYSFYGYAYLSDFKIFDGLLTVSDIADEINTKYILNNIQWEQNGYSIDATFNTNTITSLTSENRVDCGLLCTLVKGCTHLTFNSKTCVLRQGSVSKSDAKNEKGTTGRILRQFENIADTLSTVDTTDKKCLTKVDDNTPDLAVFSNFQSNTVDFCVQFCYSKQLPYALLSNGNKCQCRNSILNLKEAENTCKTPCPGNKNQMCGGTSSDVFNVFSLNKFLKNPPFFITSLGCYDYSTELIEQSSDNFNNEKMSIPLCALTCNKNSYPYFSLAYSECYCGKNLSTSASKVSCFYRECPGMMYTDCGSASQKLIFSTYKKTYTFKDPVLYSDDMLFSSNMQYFATLQSDGNLAIYKIVDNYNYELLWTSKTLYILNTAYYMYLDNYCYLNVYISSSDKLVWYSIGSSYENSCELSLTDSGNLEVKDEDGMLVWSNNYGNIYSFIPSLISDYSSSNSNSDTSSDDS